MGHQPWILEIDTIPVTAMLLAQTPITVARKRFLDPAAAPNMTFTTVKIDCYEYIIKGGGYWKSHENN